MRGECWRQAAERQAGHYRSQVWPKMMETSPSFHSNQCLLNACHVSSTMLNMGNILKDLIIDSARNVIII